MSVSLPGSPLEGLKLGVDFVKQIITLSAQLATLVSGGIYFLVQQHVIVESTWLYALGLLFGSIVAGLLALGAYIGQFKRGPLDVNRGFGRLMALGQVVMFLAALGFIGSSARDAIGRVATGQDATRPQPAAAADAPKQQMAQSSAGGCK